MSPVRQIAGGIELDLQVVPRASREGLGPTLGARLKVRVNAPPVDGAANEAVQALLARALDVPRAQVAIIRGETGRKKTVRVSGDPQLLSARVAQLSEKGSP
jgi:hypothetical protein